MRRLRILLLLFVASSIFGEICCSRSGELEDTTPSFFAFISFSIPESSLKEMSMHLEKIGGQFVLRGMPNNSFEDFLKKVMELREKGILAPITIDPDRFEEYGIEAVPTFVLVKDKGFKKVVGNVSIPYAIEKMEEQ